MRKILEVVFVFVLLAVVVFGLATLLTYIMPIIHAECRTGSAASIVYHSEGLCFGAYEDR